MKKKLILPLLAVVFAIASAFASVPFNQLAYFWVEDEPEGFVDSGFITNTSNTCSTTGTIQCTVSGAWAYVDAEHAADFPEEAGLLKYN